MENPNGRKPRRHLQTPDFKGAIHFAFDRLGVLPSSLTYHNLWHTEQVVVPAVIYIAGEMGIDPEERSLIEVAAAFHDIGFVEIYKGHELASMAIAADVLPQFGFSINAINRIQAMILATRLPQNPQNHMEEVLADADLEVLGREDFFEQNEALYQEVIAFGKPVNRLQWLEGQIKFISGHEYFTPAARSLRGFQEQRNLSGLVDRLSQVINLG
jgi:predicted metal-dependent HD superfamily phosphohydrolase